MLDLSGPWHLSDETGQYTAPMVLPGDGIGALRDAGVIPDPYWGRNEYDLRWIGERDWLLTRTFHATGRHMTLVLSMLDTVVDVSLNGKTVLHADSMFRTYRVNVSDVLVLGENVITLHFRSAPRIAKARAEAQPFPIPFQTDNCPIPHGNMLRKPECDFGWDWNIALAPFGLYGDIRLEQSGPRIADVIVEQHHSNNRVVVDCTVLGDAIADGTEISVNLCGLTGVSQMLSGKARVSLNIEAPDLWWPVSHGAQVLHDLVVSAETLQKTCRIGLRDMRLVTAPDDAGTGFALKVNDRPIFMKGANWIPADALAGAITPDTCRDLLQSAVDANMNMIRIWGGGRYEPDWFYDLCDEMGLLVWHDFMFACHLYPSTDEFLAEIDTEVREQVARLNHHACIALWCGDNELLGALTWYEESRNDRDRYLVAYDRLNRTIEKALRETAPTAIWWPSSPSPGPLSFSGDWHDDSSGDMHFWSVWHEGRDFEHYREIRPRFCSEFGFQSYPSMDVIQRFADPADFNIASPVMESHQKNAGGNARIAETMFRYFRFPKSFEDFVYLSQVQQALAIKTAVTHWRGLKPHCMGTLYWQLNDTWPVCSWSSLDHGGGWKLLHHAARRFYADVTVVAVPTGDEIELRVVNDTASVCDVDVAVSAVAPTGALRPLGRASVKSGTVEAVSALSVAVDALGSDDMLWFEWSVDGRSTSYDHFAPHRYKSYPLIAPHVVADIKQEKSAWRITLTARHLALFVSVEADQPGRFSDNCFDLIPDKPVTILFHPRDEESLPDFTLRDLHSATHLT
ncbi:glycoside hydrolase family 2 protein [Tateyamaria omphalii]|uniref:beta-mannosidase n=1 Tax=Tateyamaria omphalii TaxID=299262 RepID=UPI001C99970E|nr:glycoside hydrolase family 2 protein [Tateyamaria omphalii]MBY5934119.1 glycoside hydrolase family 2 protein [Tateyamaria omphalii]